MGRGSVVVKLGLIWFSGERVHTLFSTLRLVTFIVFPSSIDNDNDDYNDDDDSSKRNNNSNYNSGVSTMCTFIT